MFVLIAAYAYISRPKKQTSELADDSGNNPEEEKKKKPLEEYGKFHGVLRKEDIREFMDFDTIVDDMIVRKKQKQFVMVIQCNGINFDLMSEQEKISVEEGFVEFLNTLRFPIQLYVQSRTLNLRDIIEEYKSRIDNLTSEIDGIFNVTIGNDIIQMEVVNGCCVKKLKLNAGVYTTKTIVKADEYGIKSTEATFYVKQIPANISLKMDKAVYPGNISGEIITDVPGIYEIIIELHQPQIVNITNTSYRFSVPEFLPDTYEIYISLNRMNYKGSIHDRITVERGIIQAQLEIEDTPYSQDLIATVHTDIENHFIVQIGDYKRDMYVPESGLSVNLGSNWDVGSSRIKSLGFKINNEHKFTSCFCPPDKSFALLLRLSPSSTVLRAAMARLRRSR